LLSVVSVSLSNLIADEISPTKKTFFWKEDFNSSIKHGKHNLPENWTIKGTTWGVPNTQFYVINKNGNNILKLKSDKSTGSFVYNLSGKVDLKKTPILRWRWRATKLPKGGDGRGKIKDDQAIAIYVGTGLFKHDAIAYRWETETPKGVKEETSYVMGTLQVTWRCIRNKTDKLGKWHIEQKNVAKDFKQAFGYIPQQFVISISGNSHYSATECEAEVDWLEFVPEESDKKKKSQSLALLQN